MGRFLYYFFPPQYQPEVPRIGQRVAIEGQPGEYVVLHIHTTAAAADLMSTTGKHELEERVPFFAIHSIPGKATSKNNDSEEEDTISKAS
ncbi:hypothetical protein DYQ86_17750 [Acidobacteria bacterium AB60]|nr:hypothetical protein DYQ86_17750 [Acidobacteria bacterium AB60]